MELTLTRFRFTDRSTISRLTAGDEFLCYVLEDRDRGLDAAMPPAELQRLKVPAQTAIPMGRYQVVITHSNRFKRLLPLLINVPAYAGIRIHSGNVPAETDGCLLPGTAISTDFVHNSRVAMAALMARLEQWLRAGQVWITVRREAQA